MPQSDNPPDNPPVNPRAAPAGIAVFGGGPVAHLASIALARALPRSQVALVVPGAIPPDAIADRAHSAQPDLQRLHRRIGIDEADMICLAGATHRLATRYQDWRPDAAAWSIGYASAENAGPAGFIGRGSSLADKSEAHASPAAALADAGRFALPSAVPGSPLRDLDYALRFDPAAYLKGLASIASRAGIARLEGDAAAATRTPDGGIASVTLGNGKSVAADLFVDATGPAAQLFTLAGLGTRTGWSGRLPVDSLLLSAAPGEPRLSPLDTLQAVPEGWVWRSPERAGTFTGLAYNAQVLAHDAAAAALSRATGGEPGEVIPVARFRLAEPFCANVIALGDAAASFEPLGWCNLHLAVLSLELLLEVLPAFPIEPLERREFNRRWAMLADRTCDFIAAHYAGAPPSPSPFWQMAQGLERSCALQLTLEEFARRSRLPHFEEEAVPRGQWRQLLTGLGIEAGESPALLNLSSAERDAALAFQREHIRAALAAAEPYAGWYARHTGGIR